MCWDREEMSRCHEKPELLNVAPPKMSPAGLLEKAKSLVEKWPCDHAVTTHQINHMRQPARQDEDAPEIASESEVSHAGRMCWGPGKPGMCSGIRAEPC